MPFDGTTDPVREVLERAREYISTHGKPNGHIAMPHLRNMLTGSWGLRLCLFYACHKFSESDITLQALDRLKEAGGFPDRDTMVKWHDKPSTSLADVLELFDLALA